MNFQALAQELKINGWLVAPDFLTAAEATDLRNDLEHRQKSGGFKRAGTGQGSSFEVRDLVRRDEICWLERADASSRQMLLWQKLDDLTLAFNRQLFLGIKDFEGHYAAYPPHGFYQRHLDCFQKSDARVVSLILYLNQDWQPSDGGQLRIYENGSHFDIEPREGTLVCFLSRDFEHEVLLSHSPRLSFAGWFKASGKVY